MALSRRWLMNRTTSPNHDYVAVLIDLLKVATRIATPMRDDVADPEEVSVTELRIILALGGEGELAGHDLADLMAMQPMNVSRALATLLDLGLVEQVDNRENKRRKPFRLSKAGHAKFVSMTKRMAHVSEFVFEALNADEMKRVGSILAKLDQHLCEWESPPDPHHVKRP
jgi:DNA-binding MarR family transcriptional regulator